MRKHGEDDPYLHHFKTGEASTRACHLGIARLNGCFGSHGLKTAEREQMYEHLAGHLKDAGHDPVDLLDEAKANSPGISVADQVLFATWAVDAARARVDSVSESRKANGRDVSEELQAEAVRMASTFEELKNASGSLASMVGTIEADVAAGQALTAWALARAGRGAGR